MNPGRKGLNFVQRVGRRDNSLSGHECPNKGEEPPTMGGIDLVINGMYKTASKSIHGSNEENKFNLVMRL